MKKNVRFALDISVLIVGVLLLSGIFLCDRLLIQYGPLQTSPTDLLWSNYQKLEKLQTALKLFEEYKETDFSNNFRQQIVAKRNWLSKGQAMLAEFDLADQTYLKEYQNMLTGLQEDLNQSNLEYSSNAKVEVFKENITDLKHYFESKNMSMNHAYLLEYVALWEELEGKLFKTKVVTLGPWKAVLQKIENTILEAKVTTDAKEKVLEKLYYLREAANELNNLFAFSNTYLKNSKKVKIYITLMQDMVQIKKENSIWLHELIEYLRGMSLLAFLGVSLTVLFAGWLRKVVGMKSPKNLLEKTMTEQTLPAPIGQAPGKYLVNERELHAKVIEIVDSVLIRSSHVKSDQLAGAGNRNKKRNKNNKRIGRDLPKNIN